MRFWSGYIFALTVSIAFAQNDPFERFNRTVYAFNYFLDSSLFRPIARTYRRTPEAIRDKITNFATNISAPVRIIAFILSGDFKNALNEGTGFALNSTVGLLGILNPAQEIGIKTPEIDLDLAVKSWGIDSGPFLMLPIVGPSCVRAVIPTLISNMLSFDYWLIRNGNSKGYVLTLVESLDKRTSLEPVIENAERMSFDTYTFMRNFYMSRRSLSVKVHDFEDEDDLD